MNIISVDTSSENIQVLEIGYQGESGVTTVEFDVSAWQEEFGAGTASLYIKRKGDAEPYYINIPISGVIASWLVDDTATAAKGRGSAQLRYYVGDALKKTLVYPFKVAKSLEIGTPPPDPYDDYLEEIRQGVALVEDFQTEAQQYINEWLDDHPEASTTVDFRIVTKQTASVSTMKADPTLSAGDLIHTSGYYDGDTDGAANYYVRAKELAETTDDAFLIQLNNGLVAELIYGLKHINVKWCGAKGDGTTDDSDAFNLAIDKMNETRLPIYLPYGHYLIENNLPSVYVGFSIYADGIDNVGNITPSNNNHKTVIRDNRSGTSKFLLEQDASLGSVNGGYIQNISFIATPENRLYGIKIAARGWDGKIRDCGFYQYEQALRLEGDDQRIDQCQFIGCGTKEFEVGQTVPVYGVLVTRANEKRFSTCHFEHSRFMLELAGDASNKVWMNSFTSCHFEQGSTDYSQEKSTYPLIYVHITNGFRDYCNKFINCDFHALDINYYIKILGETSYNDVPFLFAQDVNSNSSVTDFLDCTFAAGPGTGTPFSYFCQAKFASGNNMNFSSCRFLFPSFVSPSIVSTGMDADLRVADCDFLLTTAHYSDGDYDGSDTVPFPHVIHAERIQSLGSLLCENNIVRNRVTPSAPILLANWETDYVNSTEYNVISHSKNGETVNVTPKFGKNIAYNGVSADNATEYLTIVLHDFTVDNGTISPSLNTKYNLKMTVPQTGSVFVDVDFAIRSGATYWCVDVDSSRSSGHDNTIKPFVVTIYKGTADNTFYIQCKKLYAKSNSFKVELKSLFERNPADWYIDRTIWDGALPAEAYTDSVTLFSYSD